MTAIGNRVSTLETRMTDVGQALSSLHQTMAQHALLAAQLLTAIGEVVKAVTTLQADMQGLRKEHEDFRRILSEILDRITEQGKVIRGFSKPGSS